MTEIIAEYLIPGTYPCVYCKTPLDEFEVKDALDGGFFACEECFGHLLWEIDEQTGAIDPVEIRADRNQGLLFPWRCTTCLE